MNLLIICVFILIHESVSVSTKCSNILLPHDAEPHDAEPQKDVLFYSEDNCDLECGELQESVELYRNLHQNKTVLFYRDTVCCNDDCSIIYDMEQCGCFNNLKPCVKWMDFYEAEEDLRMENDEAQGNMELIEHQHDLELKHMALKYLSNKCKTLYENLQNVEEECPATLDHLDELLGVLMTKDRSKCADLEVTANNLENGGMQELCGGVPEEPQCYQNLKQGLEGWFMEGCYAQMTQFLNETVYTERHSVMPIREDIKFFEMLELDLFERAETVGYVLFSTIAAIIGSACEVDDQGELCGLNFVANIRSPRHCSDCCEQKAQKKSELLIEKSAEESDKMDMKPCAQLALYYSRLQFKKEEESCETEDSRLESDKNLKCYVNKDLHVLSAKNDTKKTGQLRKLQRGSFVSERRRQRFFANTGYSTPLAWGVSQRNARARGALLPAYVAGPLGFGLPFTYNYGYQNRAAIDPLRSRGNLPQAITQGRSTGYWADPESLESWANGVQYGGWKSGDLGALEASPDLSNLVT